MVTGNPVARDDIEVEASLLVGGEWRSADATIDVANPARNEIFARLSRGRVTDAEDAIEAAADAFATWRETSALDRAGILSRTAELLRARADDIGRTLAIESGKLLFEAVAEVRFAADYFSYYAAEATRAERLSSVEGRPSGPQLLVRKPAGVVASLTPWNFPVSIQARKVAPALAAGCTVVARPSEEAPVSALELFRCLQDAGAPAGAVNLVTGPARELTAPMVEDPRVRVVSFTGSTGVGKDLYSRSAATMKRMALELGGCAPFVVCADADLDLAVEQAMIAKFRNNGQSCVAAGFEPVAEGSAPDTTDGLVPDAFFAPRLLAARSHRDVAPDFLDTELFGPLALVAGFTDLGELIARLNANPLGLAGYVFSRDTAKAARIASALEVGIAGVNEGLAGAVNMPMGGVKDSGLGREGGHAGMEEFLDMQYIALRAKPIAAWGMVA